jgi:iron complex outermembrane recepter protein
MNSRMKRDLRLALLAVAAGSSVAVPIASASAAETEPRPGTSAGGLEEILVTARKREESLQTVPVTVTAFTADQIERFRVNSLEALAGSSPDLFIGRASNGSGAQITLRGIGSQSTSISLMQSTAVVVDDVYYPSGFYLNEGLYDLQSMQVLKGPQALFFGRNATAGVISIATNDPTDKFEALARVGYEFTAEEISAEGVISGPIAENVAGRLSVHASHMDDGYFDNRATPIVRDFLDLATGNLVPRNQRPNPNGMPGSDDFGARATFTWHPTDQLHATLKAGYSQRNDGANAWNYVVTKCPSGFTQPNPAVPCKEDFVVYNPNYPDGLGGNIPDSKKNGESFNDYEAYSITANVGYDMPQSTFTNVMNYHWNRNVWALTQNVHSATSHIAATQNTSLGLFSNEARFQTKFDGPVNFMIGAYYANETRDHTQAASFAGLEDSSLPLNRQFVSYIKPAATDATTWSGFGQVTWRFVPSAEFSAGVRYISETNDSWINQTYVQSALQGLFPENQRISADQTFSEWTPEFTLSYFPTENITLYGGYKSAYKSGGFSISALIVTATVPDDVTFDPETADGFEVGMKSVWLDNQLRLNVSAYSYDYKDLQVDFFNSISFQFITTNAGEARVRGAEVETEYAPLAVAGLQLRGTLNYNSAEYRDYIAPCYGGQSIAAGCDTTFGGGPGQDLSGTPTAMAPEWTASIGGVYGQPVGSGLAWEVGGVLRYSDSYFASPFGEPLSQQDSFVNLDATLRLRAEDKRWEVAVIGRNLTDSFRVSGQLDLPNSGAGTGTATAVPADNVGIADLPRTVQLQYTQRF